MSVTEMNEASAHAARSATPVLRAVGVVKRFGDNVVLRGLDLDVASHEVVVLLGASGSGKSTLLRCANLLERVDDGQIFLGGEDITDPRANADKIRARIGVVFQHYNLFPHMSVLDNVTLAARKVHGWEKGHARERGLELLDRIGLKDKAKEYPDRLSGGQQRASRLPVRSPRTRSCFCWTRSRLRWTRCSSARSWTSCAKSRLRDRPFSWRRTRSVLLARQPTASCSSAAGRSLSRARRSR